jgi:cytochrome c-type biogenesis protein
MEFGFYTVLLLPAALGLLGFVEPCTMGAHLLFIRAIGDDPKPQRIRAVILFIAIRAAVVGLIGALVAFAGQLMIAAQGPIWLAFGLVYCAIGVAYLMGRSRWLERGLDLAPEAWRGSASPAVMGVVLAFNIPACAAPILFGLVGLAASAGSVAMGFAAMAVFGLALSLPLLAIAILPGLSTFMEKLAGGGRRSRFILGAAFLALGLWSVWFGLFVEPADWANL